MVFGLKEKQFKVSRIIPLKSFVERYVAEQGISSMKYVTLRYHGKTLLSGSLEKHCFDLGLYDDDVILLRGGQILWQDRV